MAEPDDTYRILGIDPGLRVTGYAVIGIRRRGEPRIVEAGAIRTDEKAGMPARIRQIYDDLAAVIGEFSPDTIAVEKLYAHYKHPRTAITMGHARGAMMLAAEQAGIMIREIPATKVKKGLTGNGHASKAQVQHAVRDLCNLRELPEPPDVADALAIAICAGRNV